MVKRSTWILILVFCVLVAAYLIIQNRPLPDPGITPTSTSSANLVIRSEDRAVKQIEIREVGGSTVSLRRDQDGIWTISKPLTSEADQALAQAAETQLFALRIISTLDLETPLEMIGLDVPVYEITIHYTDETTTKFDVGTKTTTGNGYYVRYEGDIYIVSLYGMDALLNLLENPPYLATQTATSTVTQTSTELPVDVTPSESTVTPTP